MKNFLKYFFISNPFNSVLTVVYGLMQGAAIVKWFTDEPLVSWGITIFLSGIYLGNLIKNIVDYKDLQKQGEIK